MKHPIPPGKSIPDRRNEIQQELARYGYRVEYDAGAIPGEGHNLVSLDTGEAVDDVPELILALAEEWSRLTDDIESSR